ncbi:winged helix-turn-helix transcriptional regulator [Nocardia sp. NPDC051321]|uniref:winged helix-turn-helix transcriptional regulator n=1 Tax=Nocardia sp. NPDC051321 TaxID=3364323 RepID=UPI0037BA6C3F
MSKTTVKSYGQRCAIAGALDVLGDRWTLLILRDLAHAPLRFLDLQSVNPGISPNLLTQRLRQLEERKMVSHRQLPAPASASVYVLEPHVRDAVIEILSALGRFGAGLMESAGTDDFSPELMLRQFECNARSLEAKHLDLRGDFVLELGGNRIALRLTGDSVAATLDLPDRPTATISAPPAVLAGLAHGGLTLDEAERRGLVISGDRIAALGLINGLSLEPRLAVESPLAQASRL